MWNEVTRNFSGVFKSHPIEWRINMLNRCSITMQNSNDNVYGIQQPLVFFRILSFKSIYGISSRNFLLPWWPIIKMDGKLFLELSGPSFACQECYTRRFEMLKFSSSVRNNRVNSAHSFAHQLFLSFFGWFISRLLICLHPVLASDFHIFVDCAFQFHISFAFFWLFASSK